ncbi:MAG: hypothetical protein ACE5GX_11590 [Thermoanaerobaculia bacterium]
MGSRPTDQSENRNRGRRPWVARVGRGLHGFAPETPPEYDRLIKLAAEASGKAEESARLARKAAEIARSAADRVTLEAEGKEATEVLQREPNEEIRETTHELMETAEEAVELAARAQDEATNLQHDLVTDVDLHAHEQKKRKAYGAGRN